MKLIAITALTLLSSTVFARPNTVDFTCSEVREMVRDNGTFILSHGDDSLYSRFVSNSIQCNGGDVSVRAYAPTLDENRCNVGYVCQDRDMAHGTYIAPTRIKVCREGSRQAFSVQDPTLDRTTTEVRTCTNGRWYPKAPAPKIIKCKEGRYSSSTEYLADRSGYFNVTRQCQNGKHVIVRATRTSQR